ncbi:MAG TPA: hypothetical protein PKD64_07465 [Pirellulaceae bacterium]|nr:hypothetical protein [Pirellulaceae bacterium]HMO92024.1 hypothetical protein [Pirellulaceae bacterium]HMP68823.1 hypothetical protein [Pirellulaceae bacterium]
MIKCIVAMTLFIVTARPLFGQSTSPLPPPPHQLPPVHDSGWTKLSDPGVIVHGVDSPLNLTPSTEFPFHFSQETTDWGQELLEASTISRFRNGFYQKTSLRGGWIGKDDTGFGGSYARTNLTVAVGVPQSVVLISPTFEIDMFSGPAGLDVPNTVYATYLDIAWRHKFNSQWSSILGVRPGVFSDFESSFGSGYRTALLAALMWEVFTETLTLVGGAVYLDRNDFDILPAVGIIWVPASDLRFDLVFPKPKISKRIQHRPFVSEDWIYAAFAIGGNTYEVQRSPSIADELTLRDFRLALGIERIRDGGTGWFIEAGWVTGRRLSYEAAPAVLNFNDTFMVEMGLSF